MPEPTKLIFNFNWKIALCVVFLFPVLVKLSVWQLDRADDKRRLQVEWERDQALPALALSPQMLREPEKISGFRRVILDGQFLPERYWLQENQVRNGQLGYQVVMPFQTDIGVMVAVDRGWVAGSPYRDFIPDVLTPSGKVSVSGALVMPSDSKLIREADVSAKVWPHKILEVDLPVMAKQAEIELFPRLLRIDEDSPGALEVYWRPINMSPAKHIGYAVQWGALAFVLVLMTLIASSNILPWIKQRCFGQ